MVGFLWRRHSRLPAPGFVRLRIPAVLGGAVAAFSRTKTKKAHSEPARAVGGSWWWWRGAHRRVGLPAIFRGRPEPEDLLPTAVVCRRLPPLAMPVGGGPGPGRVRTPASPTWPWPCRRPNASRRRPWISLDFLGFSCISLNFLGFSSTLDDPRRP